MPAKRSRHTTQEAAGAVNYPYRLRSLRKSTQEKAAQDHAAEEIKHQKALREEALHILDRKELGKFPVEQLRRLADIKKVRGKRKQSILFSLRRIYGDDVPLYPSEGKLEMKEHCREVYQVGMRKVIRVNACPEIVLKEEDIDDFSILRDGPCLRRSSRLKARTQSGADGLVFKPPPKPRNRGG